MNRFVNINKDGSPYKSKQSKRRSTNKPYKQSELPSKNTLETPGRPNKRRTPESPEDLPETSKQQTRQTRHRSTSVGEKGRSACQYQKNSSAKKNYHCTSY